MTDTGFDFDTDESNGAQVQRVDATAIGAMTSAEIDVQIATALRYPRRDSAAKLKGLRKQVLSIACGRANNADGDAEIAQSCVYALPRAGKVVVGASVRFAEILVSSWGNCRVSARIVDEDGSTITAQGAFHDLEANAAIMKEVRVRITDKSGRRYSDDMITISGNRAASVAMRNAVLAGIPRAWWQDIHAEVRKFITGDAARTAELRDKALKAFATMQVSETEILALLDRTTVAEIDSEDVVMLRAIYQEIRDGDKSVDSVFTRAPKAAATAGAKPKKGMAGLAERVAGGDADDEQPQGGGEVQS